MDGKKIRDLRLERKISLTELAKMAGVSKSYLSFIERGKQTNPSIEVLEKIANALNIDIQILVATEERKDEIDQEMIELAFEMSKSNIDKDKLRKLINLLK